MPTSFQATSAAAPSIAKQPQVPADAFETCSLKRMLTEAEQSDRGLGALAHAFSYCTVRVTFAVCVLGPLTAVTVTV